MKPKYIIAILVVAAVLVGVASIYVGMSREKARRKSCFCRIDCCIRKAMVMYAMDYGERFPTSIVEMANYADNANLYYCPGSGRKPPPDTGMKDMTNWGDYIYIHWPEGDKTPTNYPLLYDRCLSNHQGAGINLAPVGGPAFWDEGALWLQKFANEHPDLKIPMPEDLHSGR